MVPQPKNPSMVSGQSHHATQATYHTRKRSPLLTSPRHAGPYVLTYRDHFFNHNVSLSIHFLKKPDGPLFYFIFSISIFNQALLGFS